MPRFDGTGPGGRGSGTGRGLGPCNQNNVNSPQGSNNTAGLWRFFLNSLNNAWTNRNSANPNNRFWNPWGRGKGRR